ncbi:hypothetical protein J4732_18835 [Serratia marcescens]|uniref:Uncharacterized protein n=1 Tax=Serratia marcescens TaxID=615 RepID=A0A939SVH1_SERMA|nr:hypothetical protein [Serratia marcescens]
MIPRPACDAAPSAPGAASLRPQGVLTAGALQQFVYLRGLQPGKAPVVGTELVSFSALWTLRNAGVRAVAMIENGDRPVARRLSALYARLMGVPIHYSSRVTDIAGRDRVESIEVQKPPRGETAHRLRQPDLHRPLHREYTLIRQSHLGAAAGQRLPADRSVRRCSDAAISPSATCCIRRTCGDQCYQEGLRVGEAVARSLSARCRRRGKFSRCDTTSGSA